jgi:hypothetical protein
MACKGSRLGSALPCPAGRSVPGRGGPERRGRPRPDGTGRCCRAAFAACQRCSGRRGRALPCGQGRADGARVYQVALTSRATGVPFTAVLAGLQRTTTDNSTAASICAGACLRRWRSCPNWLWEQGVG